MLPVSSNTGSTDLRDTLVQQPNTALTLSTVISSRAFSANSGQSDAGSTTTASSLCPITPPFLFWASISMSMTSFSVVSLIAMVPDSECRMPILMVAAAAACARAPDAAPTMAAANAAAPRLRLDMVGCTVILPGMDAKSFSPKATVVPSRKNERAWEKRIPNAQ